MNPVEADGGRKGTHTTHRSLSLTNPTAIQDHPKETHFTKISKHNCNRTQCMYIE
jgi:hypothetical protein